VWRAGAVWTLWFRDKVMNIPSYSAAAYCHLHVKMEYSALPDNERPEALQKDISFHIIPFCLHYLFSATSRKAGVIPTVIVYRSLRAFRRGFFLCGVVPAWSVLFLLLPTMTTEYYVVLCEHSCRPKQLVFLLFRWIPGVPIGVR